MLIPNKFSGYRAGRRVYPKKDAAAPDPQIGAAAQRQIELAEKQWEEYVKEGGDRDWIRGVTEEALGISRQNAASAQELSDYQLDSMQRNDDRYWNNTVPYQDRLDSEIDRLYSQDGINNQVNNAVADVNAATSNTNAQMQRGMTRMGVNPNSGAFGNMANATSLQQATAMASAANKTRMAAEQAGLATRFQSLGAKLGMAGLGATNAGLATSALGTGITAGNSMSGSAASNISANNQTFSGVMSGMGSGISGWNSYESNRINAANVNAQNDPFNTVLGAATGVGMNWALKGSDRRIKKNILVAGTDEATGLTTYTFEYVQGDGTRFLGVMADEVEARYPEAVYLMPDGYKAVNYALLGIEMVAVEGAQA